MFKASLLVLLLTASFLFISPPETLFAAQCNGANETAGPCRTACTGVYERTWTEWDCPANDPVCDVGNGIATCSYDVAYSDPTCPVNSPANVGCNTWCSVSGSGACTTGAANCKCDTNQVCLDGAEQSPTNICNGTQQSTHGGCYTYSCGYHCPAAMNRYAPQECSVAYAPNAPSYGFDSKATCDTSGGYNGGACDVNTGCNGTCVTSVDCGPGNSTGGLICHHSGSSILGNCRNPSSPNDPTCAGVVAPNPPPGPNPGPDDWGGCGDACTSDAQCRKDQPERFCNGVCTGGTCSSVDPNQCNKRCTSNGDCGSGYICNTWDGNYCRLSICPNNSNCNCGGAAPAPTATPTPTPTPTPRPFLQTTGGNVHSN